MQLFALLHGTIYMIMLLWCPGIASKVCVGGGGGWSTANLVIVLAIA